MQNISRVSFAASRAAEAKQYSNRTPTVFWQIQSPKKHVTSTQCGTIDMINCSIRFSYLQQTDTWSAAVWSGSARGACCGACQESGFRSPKSPAAGYSVQFPFFSTSPSRELPPCRQSLHQFLGRLGRQILPAIVLRKLLLREVSWQANNLVHLNLCFQSFDFVFVCVRSCVRTRACSILIEHSKIYWKINIFQNIS